MDLTKTILLGGLEFLICLGIIQYGENISTQEIISHLESKLGIEVKAGKVYMVVHRLVGEKLLDFTQTKCRISGRQIRLYFLTEDGKKLTEETLRRIEVLK